jgi:hypothetical protein
MNTAKSAAVAAEVKPENDLLIWVDLLEVGLGMRAFPVTAREDAHDDSVPFMIRRRSLGEYAPLCHEGLHNTRIMKAYS